MNPIQSHYVSWTNKEIVCAGAVLSKLKNCFEARVLIPPDPYELYLRTHKKITTEVACFNKHGQLYLAQRESLTKNTMEQYPNQWHLPGVIHRAYETGAQAWARLHQDELKGVVVQEYRAIK